MIIHFKKILYLSPFFFLFTYLTTDFKESTNKVLYNAIKIDKQLKSKKKSIDIVENSLNKHEIQFEFIFNSNKSLYKIKDEVGDEEITKKIAQIFFGSIYKYYTDNLLDKNFYQVQAYGEYFIVPNQSYKWKMYKSTKTINGYLCYKATTTRTIINDKGVFKKNVAAWYTPEINTSFGIRGYHGLPGLILELQEDNLLFYVAKIELGLDKKITEPKKGIKVSKEEFINIGKKVSEDTRRN